MPRPTSNFSYRLHYRRDGDDMDPRLFLSDTPVTPGQIIELPETGNSHLVCRVTEQKTGTRLDLSKSASSADEALLLAEQYGDWPDGRR